MPICGLQIILNLHSINRHHLTSSINPLVLVPLFVIYSVYSCQLLFLIQCKPSI